MKSDIHPTYEAATISCACGEEIVTRTAIGSYKIEICSKCHPFFTGKQKLIDTAGRIERFKRKYKNFNEADAKKEASSES